MSALSLRKYSGKKSPPPTHTLKHTHTHSILTITDTSSRSAHSDSHLLRKLLGCCSCNIKEWPKLKPIGPHKKKLLEQFRVNSIITASQHVTHAIYITACYLFYLHRCMSLILNAWLHYSLRPTLHIQCVCLFLFCFHFFIAWWIITSEISISAHTNEVKGP